MKNISIVISLLAIFFVKIATSQDSKVLDGFSAEGSKSQLLYENQLKKSISSNQIEKHLEWLTSRPHRAGTEGAKITAEYILEHLQKFGFQTEIVRYDAFLPAPISSEIQLIQPVHKVLPTTEEQIEGDPYTKHVSEHPGWNGYSPSGKATGQIVYAHYGSKEDFERLQKFGIDLKGKILLMRYFGTSEGRKVRNAEEVGAAAVVLYTDPAEDGFRFGNVYPEGNWRPPGSIMRRSIISLPYSGDPLSPGWGSKPGAKRLRVEEVELPAIPVLPISYRSAEQILQHLDGPAAPYDWQGALGLTYKIGPGPAEVSLRTETDNRDRPIWNVIARLPGTTDPDQWVIAGNHHDAWIFGAGDPSSGTAALLNVAESLGKLTAEGIRPKRTIILTFWDAEEMLLGGSTEWVEDHAEELLEKAVAYINMDSAVFNPDRPLSVSSHPVLHRLFREVSLDITDPRSGGSLYEAWTNLQNEYRNVPGVDGWGDFFDPDKTLTEPYIFETPYDDAAPFFNFLALPSSDMYYGADYGMYHSIYENFHWMKTVVDPTFEYHKLMAELQAIVVLRLANAELIPFDYTSEAQYWRLSYLELEKSTKENIRKDLRIPEALKLIDEWEQEAKTLLADKTELLKRKKITEQQLSELNRMIYKIARDFYRPNGLPKVPTERNIFSGSSGFLPGIQTYLNHENLIEAKIEAGTYIVALQKRIESLKTLRKQLQQIHK